MKKILSIYCLAIVLFTTGCTIRHPVGDTYGQYLANNIGTSGLPNTSIEADYIISDDTKDHSYGFRAATVGLANLWIVEFGKFLGATLESDDVQSAFGKLDERLGSGGNNQYLISFKLDNYQFTDFKAIISITISLNEGDKEIFNNTYTAIGQRQGGKMFWGGAFAMQNAIHQSTKYAIDDILKNFIRDVNLKLDSEQ